MQSNGRPLAKSERQRLLTGIVARKRVGTQLALAQALAAAGCPVTQATISRDIRELGLEKTHDALGRPGTSCRRIRAGGATIRRLLSGRC
jgi:transcriptional regulator of arginine metabolism